MTEYLQAGAVSASCHVGNVHVSGAVKALLPASYTVKERGKVTVKGKGEMTTFWVESKANRSSQSSTANCLQKS